MKRTLSDRQIMEQLYALYEQKMYAAAYSILRDHHLAEDAVQEAFLRLSRHLAKFSDDLTAKRTRAYILLTIKNTSIDLYRKNKADKTGYYDTNDEVFERLADHTENDTQQAENEIYVKDLLRRLPATYQEVILSYYFRQKTIPEIAQELAVSEAAARKRLQRAVAALKTMTGDDDYVYKTI